MSDALALLLRLNLAAGAAILAVLLVRPLARRLFGARVAYGLWLAPLLAAAAMLAPARIRTIVQSVSTDVWTAAPLVRALPAPAAPSGWSIDLPALGVAVWLAGAAVALALLGWRQASFARALRSGRAGPAVTGVLRPRIVTPDDFTEIYTPRERQLILAHEAAHIARQDPRINALVALVRCANWFNPLVHVLAQVLRIDQEFACDATVTQAHPGSRRAYAQAMLKTQLARHPPPLGCAWPTGGWHPLTQRVALLARAAPGPLVRRAGIAAVALLTVGGGGLAWAARPAEVRVILKPSWPARTSDAWTPARVDAPVRAIQAARASGKPKKADAKPALEPAPIAAPAVLSPTPVAIAASEPGAPPEGCGADVTQLPTRKRLLPVGYFGPSERIRSAARWSSVEPGSAVRVYATMTAPDGQSLITDLTAFGSQSVYRIGCVRRGESRFKLFTSVAQHGQRLTVTVRAGDESARWTSGSTDLAPGQTGTIRLPDGLTATVTAYLRAETPEELAEARRVPEPRRLRDEPRGSWDS